MTDAYLDGRKREGDDTLQRPTKKPNLFPPPHQELADSPLRDPLKHVADADTNSVTREKPASLSRASLMNTKHSPSSSRPPHRPLRAPRRASPETTIDPCVHIEDGPVGYNHSKVDTSASPLNFQLPPWMIAAQRIKQKPGFCR